MGTGMSNTKKVTISLTPEQQEKARFLSKELFGKENISGLVGYLIERWEYEKALHTIRMYAIQCNHLVSTRGIGKKTVDEIIDLCNQAGVDLKP